MSGEGLAHLLFKSLPAADVRELPWITPSGFSIGIILKMKFDLKKSTWSLLANI